MDDPSLNSPKPISPISQLLKNLGMTRDDLTRHSDQMRQFLTALSMRSFDVGDVKVQDSGKPQIATVIFDVRYSARDE